MSKETLILAAVQMTALNFPHDPPAMSARNYDEALKKKIEENYNWLSNLGKSSAGVRTVPVKGV